jgi:hypothetical protein
MYKHIMLVSTLWASLSQGPIYAEETSIARVAPSGEFLELQRSGDGQIVKDYLPLHQSGKIRYFSAGVGLEERGAEYPPFSLKLVFTAGGKPYLTGVEVSIRISQGETAVSIPKEHIEGPWLFVDLPTGVYDITATYGTLKRSAKGVKLVTGKQKTLYLRWPEDAGATVNLSKE